MQVDSTEAPEGYEAHAFYGDTPFYTCCDCAFYEEVCSEGFNGIYCTPQFREDGCSVVFIKKENK